MTLDLSRIPPEHRDRVRRLAEQAHAAAVQEALRTGHTSAATAEEMATGATRAVVARFERVAAEADAKASADASPLLLEKEVRAIVWERAFADAEQSSPWKVPEPTGPRYYVIEGEKGASLVIDALVRYLADKPEGTLRAISLLLRAACPAPHQGISVGASEAAYNLVAALPDAHCGEQPSAVKPNATLRYAWAYIDGIEITARYTTPEDAQ